LIPEAALASEAEVKAAALQPSRPQSRLNTTLANQPISTANSAVARP